MKLSNNEILAKQKQYVDVLNDNQELLGLKKITWSQKITVEQGFVKIDAAVNTMKEGVEIPKVILSLNNELMDIYEAYTAPSEGTSIVQPQEQPPDPIHPEEKKEPTSFLAQDFQGDVGSLEREKEKQKVAAPKKEKRQVKKPQAPKKPADDNLKNEIIMALFRPLSDEDLDELDPLYVKEILKILKK